jgi:hypothetical protein
MKFACLKGSCRYKSNAVNITIFIVVMFNSFLALKDSTHNRYFLYQSTDKCIVTNFFIIKPTDAQIFQIYFCQETLHVSGSSSTHHQEISTVHSELVYFTQFS